MTDAPPPTGTITTVERTTIEPTPAGTVSPSPGARRAPRGSYLVALVLALGICLALNVLTFAVLYDAFVNDINAGLSENATQVLTGWGGGVLGVIGAVVGYQAGQSSASGPTVITSTSREPNGHHTE